MSVDAITFVKTLHVADARARLILFIVGENTFNDSGLCKVGNQLLADETCSSLATIKRHIAKLTKAGILRSKAQPRPGGGRDVNAIELVGFLDWLHASRGGYPAKKQTAQNEPIAKGANGSKCAHQMAQIKGANGSLLSPSYKDNRTSNRTSGARERAKKDFNSDLKVKREPSPPVPAPKSTPDPKTAENFAKLAAELRAEQSKPMPARPAPLARSLTNRQVRISRTAPSWSAWLEHLKRSDRDDLVCEAQDAGSIVVASLWPPKEGGSHAPHAT